VTPLPRGRCPVCGGDVALRVGGLVREHYHDAGLCSGSGEPAWLNFTQSRRRGLEALAYVSPRAGRRCNETNRILGYVYWQTADWLVEVGLARFRDSGDVLLELTDRGRAEAVKAGLARHDEVTS